MLFSHQAELAPGGKFCFGLDLAMVWLFKPWPPYCGHFQLQQNDHVNDVLVGILRYVYGILISILRFTLQYVVGYIHNLKMT